MDDERLIRLMAADRRNSIEYKAGYIFHHSGVGEEPLPYEQIRRLLDQWQLEEWQNELRLTEQGYATAKWLRDRAILYGDASYFWGHMPGVSNG
jgi:hypothetical protein